MGKKSKSRENNNQSKPAQQAAGSTNSNASLSEEDRKLLELAKKIKASGDEELKGLVAMLAEEADKAHKSELEEEKAEFVQNLRNEHEAEQKELDTLKENVAKLTSEKEALEKDKKAAQDFIDTSRHNAEIEAVKIKDAAKKEAESITAKAKNEADSAYKERIEQIEADEKAVRAEKLALEDEREQIEIDRETLASARARLEKQKEIYNQADPDTVANLQTQLKIKEDALESFRAEYESVQKKLSEAEILKAQTDAFTKEQLQNERDRLSSELETLQNKYLEYDDVRLAEMSKALEEQPRLTERVQRLTTELKVKELEIARKENVQLEYEQLKERVSLLRTLNDQLREELSTTKKMLESSTGDICPALTQIDVWAKSGETGEKVSERENLAESNITLPKLVHHIRSYAASKSLYYSEEDIKAFIAGLAASHLAILQGMSGTGKTSLPKIFMEAICGEVNIVPVESSWRDRNELLGYYNDFSKKYTAKEFTCDLYKANTAVYEDVPYFIVLDEMNLSRVEYYFADFLSVLENKPRDWKIQLVDIDMRQLPNQITQEVLSALKDEDSERSRELRAIVEKLYPSDNLDSEAAKNIQGAERQKLLQYLAEKEFKTENGSANLVTGPELLLSGKTISVPKNVWFIGTANRDESTFEITDKVYDRAQVLNFNERAAKSSEGKGNVSQKFISYRQLVSLFKSASKEAFNAEENKLVKEIDKILKDEYHISFGNRILDQINKFVPIYVASSNSSDKEKLIVEALDYQITNKVLRKLEYVDMESDAISQLYKVFADNNMERAKAFIDAKRKEK